MKINKIQILFLIAVIYNFLIKEGKANCILNGSGNVSGNCSSLTLVSDLATLNNTQTISGDSTAINNRNIVIDNLTNTGTISGTYSGLTNEQNSAGGGPHNGVIKNVINSGTISSNPPNISSGNSGIWNLSTITNLTNTATGNISGRNGIVNEIYHVGATIGTIVNEGTITARFLWGIYNESNSSINTITNNGTITTYSTAQGASSSAAGILNQGTLGTITNRGSINTMFENSGSRARITNFNNLQSDLNFKGKLPINYYIIINSTSNFGKLNVSSPQGALTFGIYPGSIVTAGTYQNVLSGIRNANLANSSGTFGSYNWTLAYDGTNYDLTLVSSRTAYNQTVTSPKIASTATQLEAIRTKGTKTTLINALDALSSSQLESALKKIQGTTTVKAAAQSVQAQSSFKTALSTVTSPGSSSSMTNVTKTNQGNLTFADLQTNNLYAKIQPANYSDDSAFFYYKNNQAPVNALEFFKSNRNVNLVEKDDLKDSGIFLRTFGSVTNYAAINSDDNSYGSDSYGLLGGFQHKIDENLYQGYSLGFSKSKLTLDAGEGNTKTNTIHANVYRKMDEKEYGVTASLGGYVSFIDNVRNISETSEILKSSPTNGGLDFSVQYVKKMELLGLNFYPSASLTTTYGIVKNYKETGGSGSALEIKSHNVLAIKPEIGFTLENNFIQTDKITEGANFSLFANRQQYLDGHTNTSSIIDENSWSASTLPKTKDDFLTAGIGYVAKNIEEKSDLNFNFFYTQSTNNSLNSSLFSISYNKTF
jgi:hypothetical protein